MRYIKLFLISALIATMGLTYCSKQDVQKGHEQAQKKEVYTCPMHPQVISDKPGACPICGMNLVLKVEEETTKSDTMTGMISLSQNKQMLANVATVEVRSEKIIKQISSYSYLDFAEPNRKLITARFNGRIEKLFIDKTGDYIKKNQPLFEVYSPDLVQAQNDYLVALSGGIESENDQNNLLTSARKKMELLGLTDDQIKELETSHEVKLKLTHHAPMSGTVIEKNIQEGMYVNEGSVLYDVADLSVLWNIAEVFEGDLAVIKVGNAARLRLQSFPGEEFEGKISYIYPVVNPQTRTIKVRSEFSNAGNRLKPQMYGETIFENEFGSGITVPEDAVLFTGKRNVVWIQTEDGMYEPREVQVGFKLDGKYQILFGLTEGEKVVTSGGFLIDSESQLKSGLMSGHQHSVNESEAKEPSQSTKKKDIQHKH
ncbi:MAG TPA: efflux RND transporter periplasmic adaptor subunit [bacterium]